MMQSKLSRQVRISASVTLVCKVIQAVLALVISMLTARYLGPGQYGILGYAISAATFVTPTALLGFHAILVRELIDQPEKEGEILGTAVFSSFVSSLVMAGGIFCFNRLFSDHEALTEMTCLLYSMVLATQSVELIQYWFQAKVQNHCPAICTLIAYIFISIYQLVLIRRGRPVTWFAVAKALEYLIAAIGLWFVYWHRGGCKLSFSFARLKGMLSRSAPYILSLTLVMTFAQVDHIMVKIMLGEEATGFYSAAVTCANLTEFIFIAVIDTIRPTILEAHNDLTGSYETRLTELYSFVIYLALAQSIFITALARPIITLLYGNAYLDATGVLRLLVWYTVFVYIGFVRDIWILAEAKQKYLWRINLMGALSNIALNYLMIPKFGIEGAALASMLTQAFTNVGVGLIYAPLRGNNACLLRGLNPKYAISMLRTLVVKTKRDKE